MSAAARDRSWLPFAIALGVVVAGLVAVLSFRSAPLVCASQATARSPLLTTGGMAAQPDPRLDRLATAVASWPTPFGPARAGAGYDYGQWLHLYGAGDGLLAFTKNNAPAVFLDGNLKARWALRPATKRIAWDASADRFALLDLARDHATRVGTYSLSSGKQRWCVEVSADHRAGQPVATTFLDGGDLVVALPDKHGLWVTRLGGDTGRAQWAHSVGGVARGDFLGVLDDSLVAGGVEEYRLAQPASSRGGAVITALRTSDGSTRWTYRDEPGSQSHVAGVVDGRVIVVSAASSGSTLSALGSRGRPDWTIHPRDGAVESTIRDNVVLMRSKVGLDAYDVSNGRLLWHRDVPTGTTYFPYGFTLGQMPSLDETHVLMPTTTALRILDVTTGKDVAYPLPVDGINTTYWPYQLAVTPAAIAVVTNTGGIVASRE